MSTPSTAARDTLTLEKLIDRLVLSAGTALAIVVATACTQPQQQPRAQTSPTSASPPATIAPTPRPTLSPASSPTASASSQASPTATPSASPGSSPAAACPRVSGGSSSAQAQLAAIRVAHQPGFDRLVFEFGPSTAPGAPELPAYTIEAAASLSGASGQPVPIAGNALIGVRFHNASTRNPDGTASYSGSTDLRPQTPLIKHLRLVEDFERTLVWGAGLDRLACPKVLELASPVRVVLDFATPP